MRVPCQVLRRGARVALGVILLSGCHGDNASRPERQNMEKTPDQRSAADDGPRGLSAIQVELRAEPRQLGMSQRGSFKLTLSATNTGGQVANPELHRAELQVNGQRSQVFGLAVGNGKREARWYALPPGETVSQTWSSLGESLFPHPGEYALVLGHRGSQAKPVQVQVQPD